MAYDKYDKQADSVYGRKIKAGKRRTYFFDVRATRGNDYYLTITESRKRFNDNSFDRHKIYLYKEDFNKFTKALDECVGYVKTELMPDFDFNSFNREYQESDMDDEGAEDTGKELKEDESNNRQNQVNHITHTVNHTPLSSPAAISMDGEEVDKW